MFKWIAAVALIALATFAHAQASVSGYVKDSRTLTPLPGATVSATTGNRYTTTDENGYFQIEVSSGVSTFEVRFLGYASQTFDVSSAGSNVTVLMEEDVTITDEVIVSATRATEKSAGTFSNINKLTIQKQNFGQDLPLILNWTPSLVTTSDAGAGVGYTGMRIRGSDATRINVTINGIPYNDSESQGTFWVDVPDIATSTQSIQVQRGVGTSTNGAGAFGASINLQTNARNDRPYVDVINSYGTFNTHRHTVGIGSGLLNNMFVFDGRLSLVKSDGFIDRASSNLKSFYLSGGYYGKKTMVKAIAFGGQEVTYQSWNGVPESRLKNDFEGMLATIADQGWNQQQANHLLNSNSRTFNMFTYPNQVDNYSQYHYQLHFSHRFGNGFTANAAGHWTQGKGYYEEYRTDDSFSRYGLTPVVVNGITISRSDFVRRRWLDNNFYGVTFSLNYESDRLSSVLGGAVNRYDGDHFGQVIWSSAGTGVEPNYQYYFNNGLKDDANLYWKNTYQITDQLAGFLDLQVRNIHYTTSGKENRQFTFDIDKRFSFFNPKAGLTWNPSAEQTVYGSVSVANREPVRDDFVDAPTGTSPKRERLTDLEAGWRMRLAGMNLSANYYYMLYKDQLVLTGAVNDVGAPLRTNVANSYRTGIELEASGRLNQKMTIGANLTLSQNKIREFKEVTYDYGENFDQYNVGEVVHKNTDISYSPNVIAGGIFSYTVVPGLELSWLSKMVGKQYLDNTSNEARRIDSYWINDFRLVYTVKPKGMREISYSLLANNLFNVAYQSNGYTYGYFTGPKEVRQNYYFPQAGTNYMMMLTLRF